MSNEIIEKLESIVKDYKPIERIRCQSCVYYHQYNSTCTRYMVSINPDSYCEHAKKVSK